MTAPLTYCAITLAALAALTLVALIIAPGLAHHAGRRGRRRGR